MLWTNDVPSSGMPWDYVLGEVAELIVEIKNANIEGILNELCDVYTCASCAFHTSTGIPLPLLWRRSANEWLKRLPVWEDIFDAAGLKFHARYLVNGSNHEKPWKVALALDLARKDSK